MKKLELDTVQEFQDTFGFETRETGTPLGAVPQNEVFLRMKLIAEELQETLTKGVAEDNIVEIADGAGDTIYVLSGTYPQMGLVNNQGRAPAAIRLLNQAVAAVKSAFTRLDAMEIDIAMAQAEIVIKGVAAAYEIPLDDVVAEIHRSNMSKVHEDGTIKKDASGKVIKPETYSPADIAAILSRPADGTATAA